MAQGLGREMKEQQQQGNDTSEKKISTRSVKCGDGKVIGSRRIFAPQFKLQVLDSYRKDEDCKGNQRATARKYGIHRRQIQKWLQVEASLRTSVEVGPASEPTALNLSADAARQRDDSGESRQAACQRSGEQQQHTDLLVKLEVTDDHELHLKEEEQVYEDNMEVPSMHSSDEALDFTCAALSKRRSFSLQFKLEVLDAFHADRMCHGNQRATARKFGINRRQVQKWLGQEIELRGEAAFRGGLYRQRLGRWLDGDESKRTEENSVPVVVPSEYHNNDSVNSSDQCWDLSGKKRRLEDDGYDTGFKRRAVEQTILQTKGVEMNENIDVSSSSVSARDVMYSDVQETALCLVKVKTEERPEVTSSVDPAHGFEPPIVPPPFHPPLIPLVLPSPTFDLYGVHCRHHCMHHLQSPKWFRREPELCQDITNIRAFNMFR